MSTVVVEHDKWRIVLPKTFDSENARVIIDELGPHYKESFKSTYSKIVFDFCQCNTISPIGLIFLKIWRDELAACGKMTYYRKSNEKTDSFLRKMWLLPTPKKEEVGEMSEGYFYQIHPCHSESECGAAQKEILSSVVLREKVTDETYSAVDYMLNELWDNAGAHGYECYDSLVYPKPVYICALECDDCFEIAIGDRGQGIYNSLKKKNPEIKNKKQALQEAIKNGISGHPNGSPGFGLYCSAEFLRRCDGRLCVWSSGCHLDVSSETDKIYTSAFEHGTLVTLTFAKTAVMPFEDVIRWCEVGDYIEEVIGGMFDEC